MGAAHWRIDVTTDQWQWVDVIVMLQVINIIFRVGLGNMQLQLLCPQSCPLTRSKKAHGDLNIDLTPALAMLSNNIGEEVSHHHLYHLYFVMFILTAMNNVPYLS